MMKLSDRKWKEFKLEDIFTIRSGVRLEKKNLIKGNLPFITAISLNNGISDFVSNNNSSEDSNILGVNYDGSVVENFYHPYKAIFSDSVKRLKLKNVKGNKYIYLFLKAVIYKQKNKYQYGYKFNSGRMKKQFILLPVIHNQPDYEFMEEYIKENYFRLKSVIKDKRKNEINDYRSLSEVDWKAFKLIDIFDSIKRGKRLTKNKQVDGNIPYISSTSNNNGLDNFISNNNNVRLFDNCLTLANSGSVGETFYHPYKFVASDHVTHLKKNNLNKYTYLFVANMIKRIGNKYSFNREINDFRIKREQIILPTLNDQPDYEFMEQYIKRRENEILDRI
ncbi:restriction endonuclease subunit S [Staphylococcus pettenkoferi]|nr:restriction endonuclease subunit S [Staphylococcus pettenkoferi]MDH9615668.1 restriction endonuclease subunit S [Staphylococcus pettenkoferi]